MAVTTNPENLVCRYCLRPLSAHEQLVDKHTRRPLPQPYFKCKKGPLGYLSGKAHCFAREPEVRR